MKKIILFFCVFMTIALGINAQNITGSWSGKMGQEILKINIKQEGDKLCGFTSDKEITDPSSHCKAYFSGRYDKRTKTWTIVGFRFIENSGSHILMKIKLTKYPLDDDMLYGSVSVAGSLLDVNTYDYFTVTKISSEPKSPGNDLPVCYVPPVVNKPKPQPQPKTKTDPKPDPKPQKQIIKDSVKTVTDTIKEVPKKDPVITKVDVDQKKVEKMQQRQKTTITELEVPSDELQIKLYDNGEVDNDTVTVFYNGRIIREKQVLSEVPVIINLKIDKSAPTHELLLFAENLGKIPPNTALIVVTSGNKRYEVHSSASLDKNAVLRFKYKP